MNTKKQGTIRYRVLQLLEQEPTTRNDKTKFYAWYVLRFHNINLKEMTGYEFLKEIQKGELPIMDTVDRARRKIVERFPRLGGSGLDARMQNADEVAEYQVKANDELESL